MTIDFTKFTESLSVALDYAERALLNVKPYHGMRVAVLSNKMASCLGMDSETIFSMTQAALLHDCALSEYLSDEMERHGEQSPKEMDMSAHCYVGEDIMKKLPFYEKVTGSVLYHHERADGKGAFGRKPEDTPITAQLIHIADAADVSFSLYTCSETKYKRITSWIKKNSGVIFTAECADAFLNCIDYDTLMSISGERCKDAVHSLLEGRNDVAVSVDVLRDMASVFADITDYKSHFTWRHSKGIAEKAEEMGKFYGLSYEEYTKLYIAGAVHDIGKLITDNRILEKPDKLTSEEYKEIQNHATETWNMLHGISGLEDITCWAAYHHEKLDGTGYPFRLTGDRLDKNSRLMACLDIYQALVEERPYKEGMTHSAAMNILRKLGNEGKLDNDIINDIDKCFGV